MPITPEQVQFYVREGYLVMPGLFAPEDIARINAEVMKFARGEYRKRTLNPPPALPPNATDAEALGGILAIHQPHWVDPVFKEYITYPALADAIQHLAAAHLPFWDGAAKCMQTMLFVKPPGYQGQAWHQDERYIPTRDRSLIGAWIALEDATRENGCLFVLPRSHQSGYLWPTHYHEQPDEFDWADESFGFDDKDEVAVEVKAGSVVFFNGYLLHRSKKNRSAGYRRALVNHYCNAYSLIPMPIAPTKIDATTIGTYDNRLVVPLGKDPYADRGYVKEPGVVFLRPREGKFIPPSGQPVDPNAAAKPASAKPA